MNPTIDIICDECLRNFKMGVEYTHTFYIDNFGREIDGCPHLSFVMTNGDK